MVTITPGVDDLDKTTIAGAIESTTNESDGVALLWYFNKPTHAVPTLLPNANAPRFVLSVF